MCIGFYEQGRPSQNQGYQRGNQKDSVEIKTTTDLILIYYDLLLQRGYKYEELYDMTLKELVNALKNVNKGLSYFLFKDKVLMNQALAGKMKRTPEEANPELYPPKKTYEMPDWLKERYKKQQMKGGR